MKMQKQVVRKKAQIIQHMVWLELLNTQEICQCFVMNPAPRMLFTCIFKMPEFRDNILGINKNDAVSASGCSRGTLMTQILKPQAHSLRSRTEPAVLARFCDFDILVSLTPSCLDHGYNFTPNSYFNRINLLVP